jgi:hypothetical protein
MGMGRVVDGLRHDGNNQLEPRADEGIGHAENSGWYCGRNTPRVLLATSFTALVGTAQSANLGKASKKAVVWL